MSFIQTEAVVSLDIVNRNTSTDIAFLMRDEIVLFLENNPDKKVTLDFGGYARLSKFFAAVLFDKKKMEKYYHRIAYRQMHIFDSEIIAAVMRK